MTYKVKSEQNITIKALETVVLLTFYCVDLIVKNFLIYSKFLQAFSCQFLKKFKILTNGYRFEMAIFDR